MQDWQTAIAECKKQVVSARENYKTIQTSLCRLADSIRDSIQGDQSGDALQNLDRLKDGLNAAWETVLSGKIDQVVLLDAVESFVSSMNLLSNQNQDGSTRRSTEPVDESISALIRYLDPDGDRNPGPEGQ